MRHVGFVSVVQSNNTIFSDVDLSCLVDEIDSYKKGLKP